MPRFSRDGKKVFAFGTESRGELVRYDAGLHTLVPYLEDLPALQVRYSNDGRWMTFVRYPDQTLWRARVDGRDRQQLTFAPFHVDGHAWSPDGRWIALHARAPGETWQIYLLPAAGGKPRRLTTRDVEEGFPTWSADGTRLAFGDVPPVFGHAIGTEAIHIYDLVQHRLSDLPDSNGLWTSRWSPDGRFIAALTIDKEQQLKLFDVATGVWRSMAARHVNDPAWSRDGRYIYFDTEGANHSLGRIGILDGRVERLMNLNGYSMLAWSGLALDDSPLLLRDLGTTEVYALDLEVP